MRKLIDFYPDLVALKEAPTPKPNVFCAWCNAPIGYKPNLAKGQSSHGICKKCAEELNDKIDKYPAK